MTNRNNPDAVDSANVIQWDGEDRPVAPDFPVIPFIEGDGIGPEQRKPLFFGFLLFSGCIYYKSATNNDVDKYSSMGRGAAVDC
ncbi:MAG: hypothetical protein MUO68_07775 [Desulfobacteraceae bacterium]|nr:hypothetical protein [Desulfobacteraceae bacterium]